MDKRSNELSTYKQSGPGFKLLETVISSLAGSLHSDAHQEEAGHRHHKVGIPGAEEGTGPPQGRGGFGDLELGELCFNHA